MAGTTAAGSCVVAKSGVRCLMAVNPGGRYMQFGKVQLQCMQAGVVHRHCLLHCLEGATGQLTHRTEGLL